MSGLTPRKPLETLDRDELLATVRRLLAEADALSSRISAVNEIGIAMNRTLDLDTIQRVVAKQAKWLLDFAHLSVCLRDGDGWRINTLFGSQEPPVTDWLQTENIGPVLKTGQPRLINTGSSASFMSAYASQLIIPLSADNTLQGTINFGAVKANSYTQDDMRIGYMLSLQLSSAIRNARIFEELKRTQAELNMRVEELDAYAYTIAHDLKTPLSSIILWSDIVKLTATEPLSDQVLNYIASVSDNAYLMNRMINQLLMLAKIRHTADSVQPVTVHPLVQESLKRFTQQIADKKITVTIAPTIPNAMGYDQWIEEIFANFISNAIKYMGDQNPNPRIEICGSKQDEMVRYEVRDNGLGIREEDQKRLFEKFSRLHQDKAEGLGLGLSIVHRMVKRLNGNVGVISKFGEGSTFWFTLPAVPSAAPLTTTEAET